jgi:hypothetical protein
MGESLTLCNKVFAADKQAGSSSFGVWYQFPDVIV